jgi:hypothetical protein
LDALDVSANDPMKLAEMFRNRTIATNKQNGDKPHGRLAQGEYLTKHE